MNTDSKHEWKYCSVGGVVRVNIVSGDDIAHLGELDQKLWTALSCPVAGLEMDPATLKFIDADGDGKIRVPEVVKTSKWLTDILKDNDVLLKGEGTLALDSFNPDSATGKRLHDSARTILSNLGLQKDSISLDDTKDEVAIFANTTLNGDGVIIPASVPQFAKTVEAIISTEGSVTDRSGVAGITEAQIDAFYTDLADYSVWSAEAAKEGVLPYGADSAAALAALQAVKDKLDDFYMRCKLISFDSDTAPVVDVSVDKIGAISGLNLAACNEEIAVHPIARPTKDAVLPFSGINPAWQSRFDSFRSLVLKDGFKDGLTEADWLAVQARFDAFKSWTASKKGAKVEGLGEEGVNAFLAENAKSKLLDAVAADKELEAEAASIREVDKLLHLVRDYYKLLRNFVVFSDFYSRDPQNLAVFEAGQLFIDQRCCKLCIKVADMGAHANMSSLSGMFLIYCHCSNKSRPGQFDIVAVMTDGGTKSLRPGKNAVFYDRDGNDWDAVVTKIVDNPISLKAAFWSPYRKFWEFCVGIINKSAAEKESKVTADLQKAADTTVANPTEPKKMPFDIAKFAGIFAAIGMGLGMLADAVMGVFKGIVALEWWQLLAFIAGVILVISGPSCFIAWTKLRKRNLGPVLNANGWAINSVVLVNVPFGGTLTTTAKYPLLKLDDPFVKKIPGWKKALRWLIGIVVVAAAVLYFTDNLKFAGINKKSKAQTEQCEPEQAPAEEPTEAPAEQTTTE